MSYLKCDFSRVLSRFLVFFVMVFFCQKGLSSVIFSVVFDVVSIVLVGLECMCLLVVC